MRTQGLGWREEKPRGTPSLPRSPGPLVPNIPILSWELQPPASRTPSSSGEDHPFTSFSFRLVQPESGEEEEADVNLRESLQQHEVEGVFCFPSSSQPDCIPWEF